MRLIDADAFKELLGTDTKIRETFCKVIDAQPTAYNAEKVVEELEDGQMWKDYMIYELTHREHTILKKAIEIVRKGGVK